MSKSDPHARDTSGDPVYSYHTPGMPQYTTAPPGTPNQLQTGGWLGGVASTIGSAVSGFVAPGPGSKGGGGGVHSPGVAAGRPTIGAGSGTGGGLPQRTGNTAREPTGGKSTNNARPRATTGLLGAPMWGTGAGMAHIGPPARTPRTTAVPGAAPSNMQAAVDRSVYAPRSAEAVKADPSNWAGIARDLGNAGSAGYAKYKTGGYASSAAQAYVKQSNRASMEGPPVMPSTRTPKRANLTPLRGGGPR